MASVALCSVAVLAAGTPGVVESSATLSEAQELVERATLHQRAVALTHSLADERGDMVEYVAGGRRDQETAGAAPTTDAHRARVDRQIAEILASGTAPPPVRQALAGLPETRREVLAGKGTAYDASQAYTAVIRQLHDVSRSVARGLPGDAEPGSTAAAAVATTESLPHLGRAVEQASATRGLLRGAFAGEGGQRTLTQAAQLARVREQAALADFEQAAGATAGETYDETLTGADVDLAERFIEQLTDDRTLGSSDRSLNPERVVSALSARIDRMRSVQSSLATAEVARLEQRRDDDVTALELRIALVGACLLLAVGVSVHTARSLSRPLSVLRRGSQRLATSTEPAEEQPVRFTGRNDEFAEVVRSLNELRETAAELHTRASEAEAENAGLVSSRNELAAEREQLRAECATLRGRLEAAHGATHGTFAHLGLRTLGLVERQLGLLEGMEAEASDPAELATLFELDHLATRMRRAGENLLLLAGAEHAATHHAGPVPLLDVLRAAVSEIERYERVQLASLPPHAQVSGFAADDISHLVAELLDNATAFSAPDAEVTLSAWMLENGEIMLSVQDEGIGVASDRLAELNARLGEPGVQEAPGAEKDDTAGLGNGLYVVARLAARHGLRVQLREQKAGGVAAVVVLPRTLLPDRPVPGAAGYTAAAAGGTRLPGSVAEANSNTLPSRLPVPPAPAADAPAAPDRDGDGPVGSPVLPVRVPGGDPQTSSWPAGGAAAEPAEPAGTAVTDAEPGPGEPAPTAAADPPAASVGTEEAPTASGDPGDRRGPAAPTAHGRLSPSPTPAHGPATGTDAAAAVADASREHSPVSSDAVGAVRPATDAVVPGEAPAEGARSDGDGTPAGLPEPRAADEHARAEDAGAAPRGARGDEDVREDGAGAHERKPVVTDMGLPKRTPRHRAKEPAPPRRSDKGTDAEELRRRLGGFQQGARDGHRDAAAETAAQSAAGRGGTDEEARH